MKKTLQLIICLISLFPFVLKAQNCPKPHINKIQNFLCAGKSLNISASGCVNGAIFWYNGNPKIIEKIHPIEIGNFINSGILQKSQIYYATCKVGNCISEPDSVFVKVIEKDNLSNAYFYYPVNTFCTNDQSNILASPSNEKAKVGFFSAFPAGLAIDSNGAIKPFNSKIGTYTVRNNVSLIENCQNLNSTASVTIRKCDASFCKTPKFILQKHDFDIKDSTLYIPQLDSLAANGKWSISPLGSVNLDGGFVPKKLWQLAKDKGLTGKVTFKIKNEIIDNCNNAKTVTWADSFVISNLGASSFDDPSSQNYVPANLYPSPQASQMITYGGIPVNYSTGLPNITIPLYTAKEGALSFPITLSYFYSGDKPSSEPSWVGLGWSLNAGGVITRTVKGNADEFVLGSNQMSKVKTFVENPPSETSYNTLNLISTGDYYFADSEPDVFSFQFDGFSGKFVFDENGIPRVLNDQKFKISYERSRYGPENRSMITKWTIIADNGNKYVFSEFEAGYNNINDIVYVPNAWYLTEISNTRGDKINLRYSQKDINYNYSRIQGGIIEQSGSGAIRPKITRLKNFSMEIFLQKVSGTQWEIIFSSDSLSPDYFNEYPSYAKKLNSILVYNSISNPKTLITAFDFIYKDPTLYKLMLENVGERGLNPHVFEYFSTIPKGNQSYTFALDRWGYSNGSRNISLIPPPHGFANLEPNVEFTKNGALKRIVYPTKGTTTFEYEQNSYSYIRTNTTNNARIKLLEYGFGFGSDTSMHNPLKTVFLSDSVTAILNVSQYSMGYPTCDALDEKSFTFTLPPGAYSGDDLLKRPQFENCTGSLNLWGQCAELPRDRCGYFPPIGSNFQLSMTLRVFVPISDNGEPPYCGGLRLVSMTDNSNDGNSPAITTRYQYKNFQDSTKSSGIIAQEPTNTFSSTFNYGGFAYLFDIYRSSFFNPMALYPVYYKDVLEIKPTSKIYHSFTSHFDQDDISGQFALSLDNQIWPLGYWFPLFCTFNGISTKYGEYENYDFARNLPKSTIVKDLKGNMKSKSEISYLGYNYPTFRVAAYHQSLILNYNHRSCIYGEDANSNWYFGKAYYVIGGVARKVREITTQYGIDGDSVKSINYYEYLNPINNQVTKITKTDEKGRVSKSTFSYPNNFSSAPYPAMVSRNILTPIIEERNYLNSKQRSFRRNEYKAFLGRLDTMYLPSKIITQLDTLSKPKTQISFDSYDTNGNLKNYTLFDGSSQSMNYFGINDIGKFNLIKDASNLASQKLLFDYKPFVGVNKIRSILGDSSLYEYDANNRLSLVKDLNNSLTDKYAYSFASVEPSPPPCNIPAPIIRLNADSLCTNTISANSCQGILSWNNGETGLSINVATGIKKSYFALCSSGTCTSPASNTVTVLGNLPANWTSDDMGKPTISCTKYDAQNKILTLAGNGQIDDHNQTTYDNYHWVYTPFTQTPVSMVAKINAITPVSGIRSSIMINQNFISFGAFFEFGLDGNGYIYLIKRNYLGGNTNFNGYAFVGNTVWLRVDKTGDSTYNTYYKINENDNWTAFYGWDTNLPNFNVGWIGLSVRNPSLSRNTTVFSNISVNGVPMGN